MGGLIEMGQGSSGMVAKGLRAVFASGPVAGLTDAQLLARFAERPDRGQDRAAATTSFEALLARHGPMVLGVCRALLRDEHAADDAFQATFLVLVRRAGSVRAGDSLGRWLYGVAHKVALRARADAARGSARERPFGSAGADAIATREALDIDAIEAADRRAALHEELARLSEPTRAAIVLCYLEGLTHEEAARRLGWPVGTVRSRLARGRDRLRARLARRGLAPAPLVAWLAGEPIAALPEKLAGSTLALAVEASTIPISVLSLTTGVLHAMSFAKLKLLALALPFAGLIGLAGAAVYAFQGPGEQSVSAPATQPAVPVAVDPPRSEPSPALGTIAPEATVIVKTTPPSELAAELDVARKNLARVTKLHSTGATSQLTFDEAQGRVQILESRVVGLVQQYEEELELLAARARVKKAELKRTMAQANLARAVLKINQRLNERIKGSVAQEEIAKNEGELSSVEAELEIREAELQEVDVRIRQVQRRLLALAPLVKAEPRPSAREPRPVPPPPYQNPAAP